MNTSHETELVTIDETLKHLRIGRDLLYRLIRDGNLPSIKIGGRRFLTRADLTSFVQRQRELERQGNHHV